MLVFIHALVVIYGFLGFLSPKKYLIFHAFFWPLLLIHWKMNDGKCILSQLENQNVSSGEWPFIRKFLKFDISDEMIGYITYIVYTTSWIITLMRLNGCL